MVTLLTVVNEASETAINIVGSDFEMISKVLLEKSLEAV